MLSKGFDHPPTLFHAPVGLRETSNHENLIFGGKIKSGVRIEWIKEEQVLGQYIQSVWCEREVAREEQERALCETFLCMAVWLVFLLCWRTEQWWWLASVAEPGVAEVCRYSSALQLSAVLAFYNPTSFINLYCKWFFKFFSLLICTCVLSSNAPSRLPCHPVLRNAGDDICKVSAIQQLGKASLLCWEWISAPKRYCCNLPRKPGLRRVLRHW